MNIVQSPIACDLTEVAFSNALSAMRCMPEETTVFCSNNCTLTAEALRKKHGCKVVLVPEEILKSTFAWAIKCEHGIYWSQGA